MRKLHNYNKLLISSMLFMFLFSTSFLMMPIASGLGLSGDPSLLYITGLWFWLSAVLAGITFVLANKKRKTADVNRNRPGIFCFLKNQWAKLADSAFGVSLFGLVLVLIVASQSYFTFIFVFLSVFTFLMHCVLNGKNFQYLVETSKRVKSATRGGRKDL